MNFENHPESCGRTSWLCAAQGWFYVLTGLWPAIHPTSFEFVTGAKRDLWLAQTVGILLAVSGVVLISAAKARRVTREIVMLAIGEAVVLGIIDVTTLWQPRATLIYLVDAIFEIALVLLWVRCLVVRPRTLSGRVFSEQYSLRDN